MAQAQTVDAASPPPSRRTTFGRAALFTGVPAATWYAVLVGAGFLLGGPLFSGVAEAEDGFVAGLEDARTPLWDTLTHHASWVANTGTIIATALALGMLLRWVLGRWLESFLLWGTVALQSTLFLLTTLVVSRPRPDVEKLDPAPPTSSFPSGHTGAGTALWIGFAVILASRIERRWVRWTVIAVVALVPLAVGVSRLYRGMHHPTDVVFGVLNGLAAVTIARFATYRGVGRGRP